MIVDTHTHVWHSPDQWGPQISALLRQRFATPAHELDASGTAHTKATEKVDVAFVLGFRSQRLDAEIPIDFIAQYIATAPDRLIGFAGIDPLEDDCFDRLEAMLEAKLRGIVVSPAEQGFHPMHSRAMRLFEKCQAQGIPVIVHQGELFVRDSAMEYAQPFLLDAVAREFPQLRLLLTHCGHPWVEQTLTLIGKHRNIYAELSGITARPRQLYNTLLLANQLGVTDRLLFGSDFPRQHPQEAIAAIYGLNQIAQGTTLATVPREKLRSIVERDALAALGLKRGASGTTPAQSSTTMSASTSAPPPPTPPATASTINTQSESTS